MALPTVLAGISQFLSGGLFKEAKSLIREYLPPEITPIQRAELEIKLDEIEARKLQEANRALEDAGRAVDSRIAEQEGTASDLKQLPVIGCIVLFLRGLQRPVWGFATLYMDHKWFFGSGEYTEQQQTALIVINILVLGFLFGERAIKNLEPLIVKVFGK